MPDVGLGERRRVVDPVADHGHEPALGLQPLDLGRLLLRKHFGQHALDAGLAGDGLRGDPRVAGQHDHLEPERAERGHRRAAPPA